MTEEELTKEADEYAIENDVCVCDEEYWAYNDIKQAYLAGAKPREKRIAELEQEIEELKKTHHKQRNKRIDELQKANAELTKDMANVIPLLEKATVISDLLNKAKDLIKWFVWYFREDYNNVPYKQKVKEAEQFISEVEK